MISEIDYHLLVVLICFFNIDKLFILRIKKRCATSTCTCTIIFFFKIRRKITKAPVFGHPQLCSPRVFLVICFFDFTLLVIFYFDFFLISLLVHFLVVCSYCVTSIVVVVFIIFYVAPNIFLMHYELFIFFTNRNKKLK